MDKYEMYIKSIDRTLKGILKELERVNEPQQATIDAVKISDPKALSYAMKSLKDYEIKFQ